MQDLEGKTPDRVHLPGSLEIIPHKPTERPGNRQMSKYYPPQPMKTHNRGRLQKAQNALTKIQRLLNDDQLQNDDILDGIDQIVEEWSTKRWPRQENASDLKTSDVKPIEAMKLFNIRGLAHAWHNDQGTYPDSAYLKASAQVLDLLGEED